jgi:diadenosine tetraphosphatase ApaH/serine/threonine PP2A family protein phosphatase
MRYAVLADIHSNLAAFEAVLQDIKKRGDVEEIWCLGDIVGYGPHPRECIELLRQHRHVCIAGNHDWATIGKADISYFNPDAATACLWTAERLAAADIEYLQRLPLSVHRDDFTLVHGSPREPIWEYILSINTARINFGKFETRFCLIGHSHIPLVFEHDERGGEYFISELPPELPLKEGKRLIINPGGVGQPRDGDPRASYVIYDSQRGVLYHYRVDYDISLTQQKMMEEKLPPRLATRLSYGR